MLIPYSTDAPIYHFPFATIGLMVANVTVYFALAFYSSTASVGESIGLDPEADRALVDSFVAAEKAVDSLALDFDRIRPWQWLTNNFLHANLLHLLGNMLFLWAFGLIVEGKIGWWKFLLLYLAIGTAYGFLIQTGMYLFLDDPGSAVGASGVIFGLLAIAVCWAPRNDLSCLTWLYMPRVYEIPLLVIGFIYLVWQLLGFFLHGMQMSSELLHIVGLLIGFPVGLAMIKFQLVDCEGWDIISVVRGSEGDRTSERTSKSAVVKADNQEISDKHFRDRETVLKSVHAAVDADNLAIARRLLEQKKGLFSKDHPIPRKILAAVIEDFHRAKQWKESVPWMELALEQSDDPLLSVRIKLAHIYLQALNRPVRALRILDELPEVLPEKQDAMRRKLRIAAQKSVDAGEGDIEFE